MSQFAEQFKKTIQEMVPAEKQGTPEGDATAANLFITLLCRCQPEQYEDEPAADYEKRMAERKEIIAIIQQYPLEAIVSARTTSRQIFQLQEETTAEVLEGMNYYD